MLAMRVATLLNHFSDSGIVNNINIDGSYSLLQDKEAIGSVRLDKYGWVLLGFKEEKNLIEIPLEEITSHDIQGVIHEFKKLNQEDGEYLYLQGYTFDFGRMDWFLF